MILTTKHKINYFSLPDKGWGIPQFTGTAHQVLNYIKTHPGEYRLVWRKHPLTVDNLKSLVAHGFLSINDQNEPGMKK